MDKPTPKKPEVAESDKAKESKIEAPEIDEKDLEGVTGGRMPLKPLNPQPLPPFWEP